MNRALDLDGVSSDIQVNDGIVVLGKDESELFEPDACEAVLTDVDLCKLFVVFQNPGNHRQGRVTQC